MKRGAIVLVGILVLALSPAVAPAQGLLEGGLPSLPGLPYLGGIFGGGGSCDGPGPFSFAGNVGWDYETVDLGLDAFNAGIGGWRSFNHTYRFQGLSLGVAATAVSRTGFGAVARFRLFAVGSDKDTEDYSLAVGTESRHWSTKSDTYYFDGMGFYKIFGGAAVVGGFRWNHMETSFQRPDGSTFPTSQREDESVLVVNLFEPYVGAMIDQGGASRVLRVGVIGWPQLYGNVKYEETLGGAPPAGVRYVSRSRKVTEGYFWEAFGEYGLRAAGWGTAPAAFSVFAKWTQYHINGESNVDRNAIGIGTTASDNFALSMHRNAITAGVKVDVAFDVPVPFNF
ncbi:MAG: hypothetical protein V1792_15940 [Pseudomonadota bacterium]